LVGLSVVFSIKPVGSLIGVYRSWLGLLGYVVLVLTYFLALQVRWDDRRIKILISAMTVTAAAISLVALLGFAGSVISSGSVARESSTLHGPNQLSLYLMLVWPLAFRLFLSSQTPLLERALFGSAALLMFAANLTTFSRTGWVVSFMILVLLIAFSRHKRPLAWTAGFLAVAILLLFSIGGPVGQSVKERAGSVLAGDSLAPRTALWKAAAKMAIARPVTGFGPDMYSLGLPQYESITLAQFKKKPRTPHNFPLHVAATLGLPALIILTLVIFSALRDGFAGDYQHRSLSLALVGMVLFSLFVQWPVFQQAPFWLLMGIVARGKRRYAQTVPVKALLSIAAIVILSWAAWITAADYYFNKGLRASDQALKTAYVGRANKLNPHIYDYWYAYYKAHRDRSFEDRLKVLKTAQERHPLQEELIVLEGLMKRRNSETSDEALSLADRALEIRPLSAQGRLLKGRALTAAGNYAGAAAELELARELSVRNAHYRRDVSKAERVLLEKRSRVPGNL
jgi:O-antigen ligase